MTARDTLIGIVRQWTELHDGAPETPEAVVDAYRSEVLAEARATAAAEQLVDDTDDPGDRGYNQAIDDVVSALAQLEEDDGREATPLIVSRYDTATEAAPEEEPVLTVGAIAEDGRPVGLLFDEETREGRGLARAGLGRAGRRAGAPAPFRVRD